MKQSAEERQDQLWKKNKALIDCQATNVKNMSDLAQAVKEKMESLVAAKKSQRELVACQSLLTEKDRELQVLQQQVQLREMLHNQLEACQEQVRQLTAENHRH